MSIDSHIWDFLVIGLLLLGVTLGSSWITRLPLSYALIYLIAGIFLGPYGFGIIDLSPDAEFLERLTEIVVIVSLFACGIKMNRPLNPWAWHSTVRLIGLLMPLTIGAIALLAHFGLGYDWGAAILLGAILAPTDPVLASEVQLTDTDDHNELRFGLTSEGGLNDALAFPFVYFGLYWLKDNQWDNWFKSWVAVDLIWAITAGIAGGIVVARIINALSKRLRRAYGVEEEMEDLIALATILITYALTEAINGYGFLAVFVAGVFVRRSRSLDSEEKTSQLHFTGLMERLLEVGTILLVGAMLRIEPVFTYGGQTLLIAGALIFLIRPIATWISTIGDNLRPTTRLLFGWFGIRGVGSLYYLTYALSDGIPDEIASPLSWITFFTITLSVIIHGISATPLMNWYEKRFGQENRLEPETLEEEVDREADMD
ncbi:sodium:proton antiporter [Leptolyngbya sp. NK1-12]|uniref:Sodium:proton antiporter n=1 Tax=Leptolyngbya sp. NK1-12 TaxID=2547451 RepID=A0AA96WJD2_9CYAN|nr:sodium:proton antiporter [Leptolyngbya sp. NK1-12]WNZ22436.1 sodium:proton antiporter [Leptolyngbya sp. NK1-12]